MHYTNSLSWYVFAVVLAIAGVARADQSWPDVVAEAQGQRVHFNAWAGAPAINAYIGWAAEEVATRYDVELVHVKIADAADAVARIVAERAAGRDTGGSIDLLWLNGENFQALKAADLLYGPFAFDLPNFALVDTVGKPTTLVDFTVPTEGFESPWGMAQLVVLYDTHSVPTPPPTVEALGTWIATHPGRFTYPAPPDFIGTTFLKQVLIDTVEDPAVLAVPVDEATALDRTAALWDWLERAHPHLWRGGRAFPADGQALHQLLDDGEIDFSLSFNPGEAAQLIAAGRLAPSVRTMTFDGGMLANTHFVAIPYNSDAKAAAKVVANFLLSPEAQARKQDPTIWGDPTVLDLGALEDADRAFFAALPQNAAVPESLGPTLPEPHPSWVAWLEAEWQHRFQR